MTLTKSKQHREGYVWRCKNANCSTKSCKKNIRKGSFFEGLNLDIHLIFKIVAGWCSEQSPHSIIKSLELDPKTIRKVISKFFNHLQLKEPISVKFSGPDKHVQIDETMLNYKCKSHRGRSPTNRTDALCIVEYNGEISRVFARFIPNKL